jgi:hypothetical protein
MLHACNPYASIYQMVVEWLQRGAIELSFRLLNDRQHNNIRGFVLCGRRPLGVEVQ